MEILLPHRELSTFPGQVQVVADPLALLGGRVAQLGTVTLERLDVEQRPYPDAPAVHRPKRGREVRPGGELVDTLARVAPALRNIGNAY